MLNEGRLWLSYPLRYQGPLLQAGAKLSSGAGDVILPGTTVLRMVNCHVF